MFERANWVVVVLATLTCASCADSEVAPTYMGNTNWLVSCDEDDDCSDGLSCECGVCSKTCDTSSDCDSLGASCDMGSDALVSACGSSLADSICLPECDDDDDCGRGQCVDAHCLPAQMSTRDGGGGGSGGDGDGDGIQNPVGCGPNGAFISAIVQPDQECILTPDNPTIPIGQYDVSPGFGGRDGTCDAPYMASVLLYSCLRGVDDTLQIHSAEIRLMDVNRATIVFDRFDVALPNPFLVTSNASIFPSAEALPAPGIASVELIPTPYAEQLDNFDGQQILADITLFGTTVGDRDVVTRTFTFPIRICEGCLTLCAGLLAAETTPEEIYGEGVCRDDASADGRICVDRQCTEP